MKILGKRGDFSPSDALIQLKFSINCILWIVNAQYYKAENYLQILLNFRFFLIYNCSRIFLGCLKIYLLLVL